MTIRESEVDRHNSSLIERVGFLPDWLVYINGVTFEGRQKVLKDTILYSSPSSTPIVNLKRNPSEFDFGAVEVWVTLGKQAFQAGFVPRDYKVCLRNPDKTWMVKEGERVEKFLWEVLDEDPDSVWVGLDGVYTQKSTYGMRIGLRHWPDSS